MDSRLGELFSDETDVASVFIEHLIASNQYKRASRARTACRRASAAITRENCYEMADRLYKRDHELLGGYFVTGGCVHGLEWLRLKQPSGQLDGLRTLTTMAVRYGRMTMLSLLVKAPYTAPVDEFTVAESITQNDGSILMWLHANYPNSVIRKPIVTDAAIKTGNVDFLDWLDANGYPHASPFNGFPGKESARAKARGHKAALSRAKALRARQCR